MIEIGNEQVFHSSEEIGKVAIRRFAAVVSDYNPLYWDEEYSKKVPYGEMIAPPTLVFEMTYDVRGETSEDGSHQGRQTRFEPLIHLQRVGNEYEIFQPLRPKDIITFKRRILEVKEKQGKTGKWVFVSSEITYTNQREELLGIDKEILASQLSEISTGERKENQDHKTRGASIDVENGIGIPPLILTVTITQLVKYCAATWDFSRVHYDEEFAKSLGFQRPVVDPQMYGAFFARMLVNSTEGRLKRLRMRYRAPGFVGDTLSFKSKIISGYTKEGERYIDCNLLVENQKGMRLVEGTAMISLP